MVRTQIKRQTPRDDSEDTAWQFWPDSISNFVRLDQAQDVRSALCLSPFAANLSRQMGTWCESVTPLDLSAGGLRTDVDLSPGSHDVIVIVADDQAPSLDAVIQALGRNGVLYFFCSQGFAAAAIKCCSRHGLDIRARYLVGPSLFRPVDIVPDSPDSISAYLSLSLPTSRMLRGLRRLALSVGLRPKGLGARLLVAVHRA